MAIVKVVKCPNGATVRIHDDYLPKTPEENERRIQALWDTVYRILAAHEQRDAEKAALEAEARAASGTKDESDV